MAGPRAPRTLALKAQRPTFEAAPILIPSQRIAAMGARANTRSRSVLELIRQARDYNPDVAKAVDNFISLCNPGYDLAVYYANRAGDDGKAVPDVEGLRLVRQFAVRMFSEYSGAWDEIAGPDSTLPGLDAFIAMSHLVVATQGAFSAEVELTEALNDIVDVYPVDPSIIDFQMDVETNRLRPGIMLQGPFTALDPIRFRYIPLNPEPNQPGGRSPLLAVLDVVFFQQQFLRELQAVAHMSNTPRLDIKVVEELVVKALHETRPDLMQAGNEDARDAFLNGYIADIEAYVEGLEIDDAFVHYDAVEAQYIGPQGTGIPVDHIMAAIDKMMISAVKQLPLLLGRNEGATTTHATVQWQVFIQQLGMYQRISRAFVTWALNLYLRIQGRQSYVTFGYKLHKTSDELLDAQARNINATTNEIMVRNGWITNDEAAMDMAGHPAVGEPQAAPAPVDQPVAPPRIAPADEEADRAIGLDAPAWMLRVHFDTKRSYDTWRDVSIASKFNRALAAVSARQITLTSEEQARRWLTKQLTADLPDQNRLNEALRQTGRRTSISTIQEQLQACGVMQHVGKVTNREVLRGIDTQARDSAKSIVGTYNDELLVALEAELASEDGRDDKDLYTWLRQAIAGLMRWESARNVWKSKQVATTETQANVMLILREFYTRNDVTGKAEVVPYNSSHDICGDYVSRNPYADMSTLLRETVLPAHPDCPHYGRLVEQGKISGPVWIGG